MISYLLPLQNIAQSNALNLNSNIAFYGFCLSAAPSPYLSFIGFSCTVTALADFYDVLPDRHCFLIVGAKAMVGEFAVWTSPTHTITDVHIWTAIFPPNWYPISDDSIVVSGEAMANGEFSGGDLDGDTNHATDDPHFVSFIKAQTLYPKLDG